MSETQTFLNLSDVVVAALQFGRPVLLQAALQGHVDVLRCLLQRCCSSTSDLPPSSVSDQPELVKALSEAVLGAADQGHAHCLSMLLESASPFLNVDALVNARNACGETVLIVAAKRGRRDCVDILLQHNPDMIAHRKDGATALIWAAYRGHAAVVRQLLQRSPEAQVAAVRTDGDSALIKAAYKGHAAVVSQLLLHSPEVQVLARSRSGTSALRTAVAHNHPDCMALLLAHTPSAQIDAADYRGEHVVQIAARLGHPQCLDLLLVHDPQPQHLDAAWLSALQQWDAAHARTSPHTQCLERLHAKGALLPASAQEADKAKHRLFIQDWGSRALVADRTNEAIVGLATSARGRKRKADQGE